MHARFVRRRAATWWPLVGSTALAVSMAGPSRMAHGASAVALICLHLVVGFVLIAGFFRLARSRAGRARGRGLDTIGAGVRGGAEGPGSLPGPEVEAMGAPGRIVQTVWKAWGPCRERARASGARPTTTGGLPEHGSVGHPPPGVAPPRRTR